MVPIRGTQNEGIFRQIAGPRGEIYVNVFSGFGAQLREIYSLQQRFFCNQARGDPAYKASENKTPPNTAAQTHASNALHEGQQAEAPEKHVSTGSQALYLGGGLCGKKGHGVWTSLVWE